MKVTAVVPSYEPDEKLIQVVDGLLAEGFDDIVVVNDGQPRRASPALRGGRLPPRGHGAAARGE